MTKTFKILTNKYEKLVVPNLTLNSSLLEDTR